MDYSIPNKMYVQVTSNCNMRCSHCSHDSSPDKRDFIKLETFKTAMKWEPQALLNFGGGEPTCHPLFWNLMDIAIKTRGVGAVWISTNGKRTSHALLLASMIHDGIIRGCLSQDMFHEPIGQDVIDAFRYARVDKPTIRDITRHGTLEPIRAGRCTWGNRVECVGCGMPFVRPNGDVAQCACLTSPVIGTVYDGYTPMFKGAKAWACAFNLPDPNLR